MENDKLNLNEVFKYDDKKSYLDTEKEIYIKIMNLFENENKIKQLSKSQVTSHIKLLFDDMIRVRKKNKDDEVGKFISDTLLGETAEKTVYNLLNIDSILNNNNIPENFQKFILSLKKLYTQAMNNVDANDKATIAADIPRTWDPKDKNIEYKKKILTDVLNKLIEQQKGTARRYTQGINFMAARLIDQKLKEKSIVDRNLKGIGVDNTPDLLKKDISTMANTLDIMCEIYDDIFIILSPGNNQVLYDKLKNYSKLKEAFELFHKELNYKLKKEKYKEINIESIDLDLAFTSFLSTICFAPYEGIEKLNSHANGEASIGLDIANSLMQLWFALVKRFKKQKGNSNIAKECAEKIVYKTLLLFGTPDFINVFFVCCKPMNTFEKEEEDITIDEPIINQKIKPKRRFFSDVITRSKSWSK